MNRPRREAVEHGPPFASMPPMPYALLAAACFGMFAASCSGNTRAPFLIAISRDLEVSLPLVANLMAVTSVTWGLASLVAGGLSDRFGRRPFLLGGPLGLAASMFAASVAPDYVTVALAAATGGAFAGAYTGVVMAEASSRVVDRQRGRALGWIMAGQSLTLLVGVPLAAWIGAAIGWRGVHAAVGGLAVLSALAMLATTRRVARGGGARAVGGSLGAALSPRVVALLVMGGAERVCYGLAAVYFATFLQSTYGLGLGGVAVPLALFALGSIGGTLLGGQLADRLADRLRTFAAAMFGSALLALPLYGWTPSLAATVGLGFGFAFVNGIARPSLMAAMANVPDAVRGTVLGLNVTSASVGWLGAATLGGWMLAGGGFAAFGPLSAGVAAAGGLLALRPPAPREGDGA